MPTPPPLRQLEIIDTESAFTFFVEKALDATTAIIAAATPCLGFWEWECVSYETQNKTKERRGEKNPRTGDLLPNIDMLSIRIEIQ